jgi:TPR repeat protein
MHEWPLRRPVPGPLLGIAVALILFSTNALADPFRPAILDNTVEFEPILSGKDVHSPAVARIKAGDIFYVKPSDDSWWLAQAYENKTGFVKRSSLRIIVGPQSGGAPASSKTPADIDASANPLDKEDQYKLGLKFLRGIGVPIDSTKAASWFARAALQGQVAAKADLALLFFKGEGVKRDRKLAMNLLEEGIAKGDARALVLRAGCFAIEGDESNDLGTKDRTATQIISLLEKAAIQGGEDGVRASILRTRTLAYRSQNRINAASRLAGFLFGSGGSGDEVCSRCGGTGREFTSGGDVSGLSCERCGGSGYVAR